MKPLSIILVHFRFLLAMNLMWSMALLVNAFAGATLTNSVLLILVAKIIGYGLSVLVEMWFYAEYREYYFKNLGVSYHRLFAYLILFDMALLVFVASLWLIIRNFI